MSTTASPSRLAWVSRIIGALLVVDVAVFLVMGANRPKRPTLAPLMPAIATTIPATPPVATPPTSTSPTSTSPTSTSPAGTSKGSEAPLTTTGVLIKVSGGLHLSGPITSCFALADTAAQRAKGLMNRTSLGRYRGMALIYTADSYDSYVMRDTPLPLQIAFFAADGAFLSSAAMAPCPNTTASCPQYSAPGPFRLALEVPLGQLRSLGIGTGSTAQLAGACRG